MPPRRRPYARRTRKTPRRTYRKRWQFRSRRNKKGQKLYLYKRHVDFGEVSVSNITPTFASYQFRLNQVPDYTEFTNLYDMYKINAVKLVFIPKMTQSVSIGTVNNPENNARFFSVLDYNDGNVPVSVDELRQYQSCRFTQLLRTHKRYVSRPRIQDRGNTYNPGRPWINTTAPDQEHFGMKIAIEPMGSTTTTDMPYSVEAVFYMSFRTVK